MARSIDKQAGKLSYTRFAVSGMPSDRVGSSRGVLLALLEEIDELGEDS